MTGRPLLAKAAAAIAAFTIVLYQAWFMPFFQPFFAGRTGLARGVFYAIYGSLVLVSAAALFRRSDIRRKVTPFAVAVGIGVAATALHPIGLVTRAYIIAMCMGGATMVLMLASAPMAVLRLTAAVTVLNAALCFIDLLFADGFTGTFGRAAGLAINPNVAAAAILLGAAASHRAVPKRFYLSFLVLTGGSLAITLSRSTVLAAALTVAIPAAVAIWPRARARRTFAPNAEGLAPAALLTVGLVAWIGLAAVTNGWFRPVVQAMVADSLSAEDALEKAHVSVTAASHAGPAPVVAAAGEAASADLAAIGASPAPIAAAPEPSTTTRMAALDTRLVDEGHRNTISARTLFLERALLAYRGNGFFGIGLEAAHHLVPHNTFVLFALAFGHLGWLVPIAMVALAVYSARDARDLPLAVAALGTMVTSHDIFVTPSLFLPIAIGIGGMIAREPEGQGDRRFHRVIAMGSAAAVVLFAAGCLVIRFTAPSLTIGRVTPGDMTSYRGGYLVRIPTQTFPGLQVSVLDVGADNAAMFLREDSRALRHVDSDRRLAPGEYAIWQHMLIFVSPDAGDPRTAGHLVELGLPNKVGPLFSVLLATLAVWGTGVLLVFGRRGREALG